MIIGEPFLSSAAIDYSMDPNSRLQSRRSSSRHFFISVLYSLMRSFLLSTMKVHFGSEEKRSQNILIIPT